MTAPSSPPVTDPLESFAARLFGSRLPIARGYAGHLAVVAVERGLVGPREGPRVWDRHVLNSAVVQELIPLGASVLDLGSGAGLPGIPIALARPDLRMTLLDSMLRRTEYLTEVIGALRIGEQVHVVRSRAEDHCLRYDVIVARAVGALPALAGWSKALLRPGGVLLALRGRSAAGELAEAQEVLRRAGWHPGTVEHCGEGLDQPTVVVRASVR